MGHVTPPDESFAIHALHAIQVFHRAFSEPMERACEVAVSLGWDPARDCRIKKHDSGGVTGRREVLEVNGRDVFEISCKEAGEHQWTVTARWLELPSPKPATAYR